MQRWFIDFETYWAADFTLSKITPPEYIMDPRFEALGCAVIDPAGTPFWYDGHELPDFFDRVDWDDAFVVSHNALFDMMILSLRYGKVPAFYGCTLSMARNWISHATGKSDLKTCAQYYGLPPKGDTTNSFKGMTFAEIRAQPALYNELQSYAIHDAQLCKGIFERMMLDGFPVHELKVIDMVTRMASEPAFALDQMLLSEHLATIQEQKAELLREAQLDSGNLSSIMSDQQLAVKLTFLRVQVPMKKSKKTGKQAFAFAKTDEAFTDLLEHDNPMVQALVAARLGHKSTIEETRTQRMIDISLCMPRMPIPLKYSGAHTHRFSGDWKVNAQNLPNESPLRRSLIAPKGMAVVSVDASQIEARINAVLSGQNDLVEDFRKGIDVYSQFAEELYGYPVHKDRNKIERFVGKQSILSLGYQSSWPIFQNMCRNKGDVSLTDSEAASIVEHYRNKYTWIRQNWREAQNNFLPAISNGYKMQWGPVEIDRYEIKLPNGNRLRYPGLRHVFDETYNTYSWLYNRGPKTHYIYGAKLVENVVQALAFVYIMDAALKVAELTNGEYLPAHQVHDELIYVAPAHLAEKLALVVREIMSTPPVWMPTLPVASSMKIGPSYGELEEVIHGRVSTQP